MSPFEQSIAFVAFLLTSFLCLSGGLWHFLLVISLGFFIVLTFFNIFQVTRATIFTQTHSFVMVHQLLLCE